MPGIKKPPKKPIGINESEIAKLDLDSSAWPKFEKLIKDAAKQGGKRAKKPEN
jgi:hypothetical protein